jgi:Zn-dependent peptidase ImmA (M78 family)/transcriptional regulator with XRE-family HTH domain
MHYEELPVTPALITWARKRAGISVVDAARKFKRIQAWEDGKSSPTYPQLEQLAGAFKVPIAVFFFPEPPAIPDIHETFRTLPDAEFDQIPGRVRLLLRKAKALQLNLMELTGGRNPAERLVTRDIAFDAGMNLSEMAERVRLYLRVSLDVQRGWADDDTALKHWRDSLLAVGIYVFKDAFRVDEFSGFCLYDDIFPLIYVNNSSTKTRQIFTLFHELAHLLFHTSGIDTIHDAYIPALADDAQRIEILCNRFAAEFLLPEAALIAATRGLEPTEVTAERVAASFHVSREVVFRRFLDRGFIDQSTYNAAALRWAAQRQVGGAGGDYYWTKLAYLGRDYVGLALSQYRQNRIDERQLADYLDTKPKNLAGIEDYFGRSSS